VNLVCNVFPNCYCSVVRSVYGHVFKVLLTHSRAYKDTHFRKACYLLSWPSTDTGSGDSGRRRPTTGSWHTSLRNTCNSVPSSYATLLTWSAWKCGVLFALIMPIWHLFKTILRCLFQPHAEMGTTESQQAAARLFIVSPPPFQPETSHHWQDMHSDLVWLLVAQTVRVCSV
jgi:hypothetical protein